jgi:predicted hotdog family 3-hydroxylacyl-ACP dehydratase
MLKNRAEIAAMIPHAEAMCLLDGVVSWDENRIRCMSRTHRDKHNPMRAGGQLRALCGIEYAAQAMAVHGKLAGNVAARPQVGYMASLRDVVCTQDRLDNLDGDLVVDAERVMGEETRVIYRFIVRVGETEVLSGRAAVVLDAGGGRR